VGLLDHLRTHTYRVQATPSSCMDAFEQAFKGGLLMKGNWSVARAGQKAVARYEGRGGLLGAMTIMSETGSATEARAQGSEITLEIVGKDHERTICSVWLSSRSSRLGFTDDAAVMRRYMHAVDRSLRGLDPSVQVAKN
jgi:hypothetical protein